MTIHMQNGVAYAEPLVKVVSVQALAGHRLWLRFSTGEEKTCDIAPLLETGVFSQLRDEDAFARVGLDYGVPTWPDLNIDISPEYLYQKSRAVENHEVQLAGAMSR